MPRHLDQWSFISTSGICAVLIYRESKPPGTPGAPGWQRLYHHIMLPSRHKTRVCSSNGKGMGNRTADSSGNETEHRIT